MDRAGDASPGVDHYPTMHQAHGQTTAPCRDGVGRTKGIAPDNDADAVPTAREEGDRPAREVQRVRRGRGRMYRIAAREGAKHG